MLRDILDSPTLLESVLGAVAGPHGRVAAQVISHVRRGRTRAEPAGDPEERAQRQFVKWLRGLAGGVILVVGRRGTGKTALTLFVAEQLRRPVKVVGIEQGLLPPGWEAIEPSAVTRELCDCVVAIDDAALSFNAYDYSTDTSRAAHDLADLSRQRRVVLIINVQRTAALDRYLFADPDVAFLKPPSMMFLDGERDAFKRMQLAAKERFDQIAPAEWPRWAYVYSDLYQGMMRVERPTFWTEALSRNKAAVRTSFRVLDGGAMAEAPDGASAGDD